LYIILLVLKVNISIVSRSFMVGMDNFHRHWKSDVEVILLPLYLALISNMLEHSTFW